VELAESGVYVAVNVSEPARSWPAEILKSTLPFVSGADEL
jgi:hypothetical protein